jgi:hypothetical protein
VTLTRVLRLIAVAIAIGGVADPAWTRSRPVTQPVRLTVIDRPTLDLPGPSGTRREMALTSAETLRNQLASAFDVTVQRVDDVRAAACTDGGACVLIGDGPVPNAIPESAIILGGVSVAAPLAPNVAIAKIDGPLTAGLAAAASVRVHLRGVGVAGTSRIDVIDEDIVVGSAEHQWTPASGAGEDAAVDVSWVPLAAGARRLRIAVSVIDGEAAAIDNVADVGAVVRPEPIPVLIYEPEAAWSGTFIRRAIERDSRFALQGGTRLAPSISVAHAGQRALTAAGLARARLVVIASPHALNENEVALLERFARVGGGSVALLFDRRPEGPALRLLPAILASRELTSPQAVGPLNVMELVTFGAAPGITTLAAHDNQPVIVSRAMGRGRIVISGALDAWRFRDNDRFTTFWIGVLNDAALAAGSRLDLQVTPTLLAPGDTAEVTVRWHGFDVSLEDLRATAYLGCGSERVPVRLWPTGRPGVVRGTIAAEREGGCEVTASLTGEESVSASTPLVIANELLPIRADGPGLAQALASHGAPVYKFGEEAQLADAIRAQMRVEHAPQETHPFRSPWWVIPFSLALASEWWVRRAAGLR